MYFYKEVDDLSAAIEVNEEFVSAGGVHKHNLSQFALWRRSNCLDGECLMWEIFRGRLFVLFDVNELELELALPRSDSAKYYLLSTFSATFVTFGATPQ